MEEIYIAKDDSIIAILLYMNDKIYNFEKGWKILMIT